MAASVFAGNALRLQSVTGPRETIRGSWWYSVQLVRNRGAQSFSHAWCLSATNEVSSFSGLSSTNSIGFSNASTAKLVAVVGSGSLSPWESVSWKEVLAHMARKLAWLDGGFQMLVVDTEALCDEFEGVFRRADILVAVSVNDVQSARWILGKAEDVPTLVAFESLPALESRLGGHKISNGGFVDKLRAALPLSKSREACKKMSIISEAWSRDSSDNILFALQLLINEYVTPVKGLQSMRASSLQSVQCMIGNCGPQVLSCLLDPECRKALDCLQSCAPTDQVCSYRCIVSYENPHLEAFTLCILQKHNCLGLSAEIQMQPDVQPMTTFRGEDLTHSLAEDLLIGWLQDLGWSWKVVAGQNAAYDQFPCQYQIFYRGKGRNVMWYDPLFQVQTLDGTTVWRRRHYRVKRAETPGTFFFSVLDNGVVSKEFWRIVDVTDDLSWALFYYSGAAAAAGQAYTGAVLVTPDGQWPDESQAATINIALERCGIKLWELFKVDNACCMDAPLALSEDVPSQANLLKLATSPHSHTVTKTATVESLSFEQN